MKAYEVTVYLKYRREVTAYNEDEAYDMVADEIPDEYQIEDVDIERAYEDC